MNNFICLVLVGLIMVAPSVSAGLITVGNIQTDDATNFMTDLTTGRIYSRLDATLGRTYNQLTEIDTISGGVWDGWSLATSVESDDLIRALLGGISKCDGAVAYGTKCGQFSAWSDDMLGKTSFNSYDYWMYYDTLSTPGRDADEIGLVAILNGELFISDHGDWSYIADADWWSTRFPFPFGYLLYSDKYTIQQQVPAPSSLSILALGLIGLTLPRFKKKP